MKKLINLAICCQLSFQVGVAQNVEPETKTIEYKKIDTVSLVMELVYPPEMDPSEKYPGMVFFFGGGWVQGTIKHFERQANYFAKRGMVCFLVDYRVKNRHGTTPFDALTDAKSSIRYIRKNAARFNVDPNRLIASGGSAGGHLAAATAVIKGFNDPADDPNISAVPNALVLFNPVVDTGPASRAFDRIGEQYKDFSPLHNVRKGAPPTIIFQGTQDQWTPNETIQYYQMAMQSVGSRCDLFLYEGQQHGFFNFSASPEYYQKTVLEADRFLSSLGYLDGEPTIMKE